MKKKATKPAEASKATKSKLFRSKIKAGSLCSKKSPELELEL